MGYTAMYGVGGRGVGWEVGWVGEKRVCMGGKFFFLCMCVCIELFVSMFFPVCLFFCLSTELFYCSLLFSLSLTPRMLSFTLPLFIFLHPCFLMFLSPPSLSFSPSHPFSYLSSLSLASISPSSIYPPSSLLFPLDYEW